MISAYDVYAEAPTSILLVDAHHPMRIGVATLIDAEPDLWVAAQAAKSSDIQGLSERNRPALVVADLKTLEPDPAAAVVRTRACSEMRHVVILAHVGSEVETMQAVHAGAHGYFLWTNRLTSCSYACDPHATATHFLPEGHESATAPHNDGHRLSPRELHMLTRLASGHTTKRIGAAFGISEGTVQLGFSHIFNQLGVNNRCSAVALAESAA